MKRIIALLLALLIIGNIGIAETEIDLSNMSTYELKQLVKAAAMEIEKSMEEDDIINSSIALIKEYWRDVNYREEWYCEKNSDSEGYLEIVHTNVVYLYEELDVEEGLQKHVDEYLKDIYCFVEFELISDRLATDPYFFNCGLYDCVTVYTDGRKEVCPQSPLEAYRSRTFSNDFDGIVEDFSNRGSEFNAIYYLLKE
jgi:hypothetical protein